MFPPVLYILAFFAPIAPIDVGSQKQLFIDEKFIAERQRIELRMNQPQKLGFLLDENDKPFSGHISRVIDDGGKARLYLGHKNVQILESDDGLKFRRTGAKLPGGLFPTVFLDPHETDPAKKYKMFHLEFSEPFDATKHGVFASYSADGLKFTKVGRVLPFFTDNPPLVYWDERIKKYIIYTRAFDYDSDNQRQVGRIETDDPLKPWPFTKTEKHRTFPSIQNLSVVYAADKQDDAHSDVYYNSAGIYPWAQDVYLMFPTTFRHFSRERNPYIRPPTKDQWEDFGMLEVQLAVSRDGIKWTRPSRESYIPNGLADEWDRWYSVAAEGLVRRGNYVYQYYYSSGRLHDGASMRPEYDHAVKQSGGVGVVKQRLDGYVSVDADHLGGWLKTPPLTFAGNRLRLNIDTGSMGTAFVELQDKDGKPYPGFAMADCEEIAGNYIDQSVYWKGKADVSSLAGQVVRLHIKMKRSKLYAFQFTKE